MIKNLIAELGLTTDSGRIKHNLEKNLLTALSFFIFIVTFIPDTVSAVMSLIVVFLTASQLSPVAEKVKNSDKHVKILSAVSGAGICLYAAVHLYEILLLTKIADVFLYLTAAALFILIFPSVFVLSVMFFGYLQKILLPVIKALSGIELTVYAVLLAGTFLYSFVFFSSSVLFYGAPDYNFLYSSDSAVLVSKNCYLDLDHIDNDIRQPLFAVFAAPLTAPGYLVSFPFTFLCPFIRPLLMNFCQLFMMLCSVVLFSLSAKLEKTERIAFTALFFCTYTSLLFSVMMEQYIVAVFWLSLLIYEKCGNGTASRVTLSGAGGTLVTSLIFAPLTSKEKKPGGFTADMIKSAFVFVYFILAFGRTGVVVNVFSRVNRLLGLFGKKSGFLTQLCQFTHFVSDCFISPGTAVRPSDASYHLKEGLTWQLDDAHLSVISISGVIIIVLCVIGFILTRHDTVSMIAGTMVLFSFVLLAVIGWGAPENGMVLYSLYFSWAYYILLFKLVKYIGDRLKIKAFVPAVCAASAAALVVLNFSGVVELYDFAVTYYPV